MKRKPYVNKSLSDSMRNRPEMVLMPSVYGGVAVHQDFVGNVFWTGHPDRPVSTLLGVVVT